MGAFHARTLQTLESVDALTIADPDPAIARRVADDVGANAADSPEALVAAGVEALVIATPTAAHASLLRLAADARLPGVLREACRARASPTLDAVIADVERAGILVQVGFQRRFDAGFRAAREAVAAGALGTLLVSARATHDPAPPPESYIAGSGGIFRDLHIHDFDAIRFVTGPEIVEVYAAGAVRATPWFDGTATSTRRPRCSPSTGGAARRLDRHASRPARLRRAPRGLRHRRQPRRRARRRTPLPSVEPGIAARRGRYRDFLERFGPAYRAELAAFVETVRDGGASPCTLADARAALAAALPPTARGRSGGRCVGD